MTGVHNNLREHRIGMIIADREFSIFWRQRNPRSSTTRWPLIPWAIPLVAATGIAIAMPTKWSSAGDRLTVVLDDPTPMASAPPAARSAPLPARSAYVAPIRKTPMVAGGDLAGNAIESAIPSQSNALTRALRSGEPTEWRDALTGESGIVVAGVADDSGCRDVVVMTRRADGNNDNAPSRVCR